MILEAEHLGLCTDSMIILNLVFFIYIQLSWQNKEQEAKPRGESEHVQFEKLEFSVDGGQPPQHLTNSWADSCESMSWATNQQLKLRGWCHDSCMVWLLPPLPASSFTALLYPGYPPDAGYSDSCLLSFVFTQLSLYFVVAQSLSFVWLFASPRTAGHQASLSFTISWSLLQSMPFELVILSNHLILCHPFLALPSVFPSIFIF